MVKLCVRKTNHSSQSFAFLLHRYVEKNVYETQTASFARAVISYMEHTVDEIRRDIAQGKQALF